MEQVTKLLEQLSAKLGTTVEYLWGVLIKQATISGLTSLLGVILGVSLLFICHKLIKKAKEMDEYNAMFPIAGAVILFFVCVCLISFGVQNSLTAFFNPEYWALKEILQQL